MRVIAIGNRKGGSGKTTTVLNIGAGLHRQGKRILFVDLDSQGNLTKSLRIDPHKVKCSSLDVLTKSKPAIRTITETTEGDLIPANPDLVKADLLITGNNKEYRLRDALKPILSEYDYILIDTAPQLGICLTNALTASDELIITSEAKQSGIDAIGLMYPSILNIQKRSNPSLRILGILLTRFRPRTILAQDMRENMKAIAERIGTKVFDTAIRECNAIGEAEFMRESIFSYERRSNGAIDYQDLITEITRGEG